MKKSPLLLTVILLGLTANVWAGKDDQVIIQEAAKNNITVAQALRANDEVAVTLTGTIVGQTKHEHYELKDSTGTIGIEVDDDLIDLKQLKSGTQAKVVGEVDTHRYKPTDIEVVKIEIIP